MGAFAAPAHFDPAGTVVGGSFDRVLHQVREDLVELLGDAFDAAVAVETQVDLHLPSGRRQHDAHHVACRLESVMRAELPRVTRLAVVAHQLDGASDAPDAGVRDLEQLAHAALDALHRLGALPVPGALRQLEQ